MRVLDLPRGNRKLDLLKQGGGIYTFGDPRSREVFSGSKGQVARASWILSGVCLAGIAFGLFAEGSFRLLVMLAAVVLVFAVIGFLDIWSSRISPNYFVIDMNEGRVHFPEGGEVERPIDLEELTLTLVAGGDDTLTSHDWWVVLEGSLGKSSEGEYSFQARIYGPGFKPDMVRAAMEIRDLGDWGEVRLD